MKSLEKIISVDQEKCVNCHKCISVCPVKYCNDGSGDHVEVNKDMCIACGQCLPACTHDARTYLDDTDIFLENLRRKQPMIAIVAPSIAANFPGKYLQFNSWLKSLGIKAVFDVSFGAELTIKSYLTHLKQNNPSLIISQPCPAIVTYIELYKPELLKYLAPADSPMMHTMKMVREYYPQYRNHKMAVISPCIAKKREFMEVGIGDYNVTMSRLQDYMDEQHVDLNKYPANEFDNDPAERAVLFSTPGGLLRTAERDAKSISRVTRKIEGPEIIYEYLEELPAQISKGYHPALIDCLNCHKGCNGGTGTRGKDLHQDELEHHVEQRNLDVQRRYKTTDAKPGRIRRVQTIINKYWKPGLYNRAYTERSDNDTKKIPDQAQFQSLYQSMSKVKEEDHKNCASCGYNSCESMAIAIHNGLNKTENCYFYIETKNNQTLEQKTSIMAGIELEIRQIGQALVNIEATSRQLVALTHDQMAMVSQTSQALQTEAGYIEGLVTKMKESATVKLVELTQIGGTHIENLNQTMKDIGGLAHRMKEIIITIDEISNKTNILSINASIQSAHAGEFGKPFSVVAHEIKNLASNTANHVEEISRFITTTNQKLNEASTLSKEGGDSFKNIAGEVKYVDDYFHEVEDSMGHMSENSRSIYQAQDELNRISQQVLQQSQAVEQAVSSIKESLHHLKILS